MAKKIYLSPAAHGHDNPCSYSKSCGENVHCNLYMDELEPILKACGFDVKRAPKGNTGGKVADTIAESNAWKPDLHYVCHTNAGKGHYSKLMVYDDGTGYTYAGKIMAEQAKVLPCPVKITIEPQWSEICETEAIAVYDELVFHDNLADITWLHGHFHEMAAATVKGICNIFGYKFVDPAVKVSSAPAKPATPAKPVVAPKMRVGAKVQYSGRLYGNSNGGGPGRTVSGSYTVSRYLKGKKCGVLLNSGLGWVPESACKVIG